MAVIEIKNFIAGNMAVSYEDGQKCLHKILQKLDENGGTEKIILDFAGVDYVITAF